jgi:pilus assembly protein Flp/PilA
MHNDPIPNAAAASPSRRGRWRLIKRFQRSQDGATAIEFALIAGPFFLLFFAIVETVVMLWTNAVLEEAVSEASRRLLTGASHARYTGSASANTEAFTNDICNYATGFINCEKLKVDVKSYSSFASAEIGSPLSGGLIDTSSFAYRQPQPGDIVVVRGVLEYTSLFSQWSDVFVTSDGNRRALVASAAFRTEPYTAPVPPPTT